MRQEDPSSEEVQKTDVETKRSLKPMVYLHFKMVHGTETCPVAAGVGWQVLSSIFLSRSHAGFLSHNYSITLLLNVDFLYTLTLVLEVFILQAYKVSGV